MTQPNKPRANPALRLAAIRRIHGWLGLFIAPSILFFALTGSLQLYGLHESHTGYKPPALVEKLGMVHKDQVFKLKPKRPAGAPKPAVAQDHDEHEEHHAAPADEGPKVTVSLLKALFLIVALGLATSTILGVWMALAHGRDKRVGWIVLAAGAVLPILLAAL
jgi:hypothetical protein